jgi:hypothetical protein
MYEPYVAIDPDRPERIAAVAMYGIPGGFGARSLYAWLTEDGGDTWRGARIVQPREDLRGSGDPLVAFAEDGVVVVAGMILPGGYLDLLERRNFTRATLTSWDELMGGIGAAVEETISGDTVFVARFGDGLSGQSTVELTPSVGADKPSIAVDRVSGAIYVAWHATADQQGMVHVSRSDDGARTFTRPVRVIDESWGPAMGQLAVRPDGALHVVWALGEITLPGARPESATSVWHAHSRDGGRTFSEPTVAARHAGLPLIGIPTLAGDASGRLLAVWPQGEDPGERLAQVRHHLYAIRSDDGVQWSEPEPVLPDLPPTTMLGLADATADGDRFWIVAYLADDASTRVVLLVSDDGGRTFARHETLAERPIAVDDISLNGNYLLRHCTDVVQVGDYAGIAAAGGHVAAAFVLPENDDPTSTPTAYVALIQEAP